MYDKVIHPQTNMETENENISLSLSLSKSVYTYIFIYDYMSIFIKGISNSKSFKSHLSFGGHTPKLR